MVKLGAIVATVGGLIGLACGLADVNLDGKRCDVAGNCSNGYVCDRASQACVRAIRLEDGGLALPDGNVVDPITDPTTTSSSTSPKPPGSDGAPPLTEVGPQWTLEASTVQSVLRSVAVRSNGEAFAVGDAGVVLHRSTTGVWNTVDFGYDNIDLYGVALNGSVVWICGAAGMLAYSKTGQSFTPISAGFNPLRALTMVDQEVWAVGDGGVVFHANTDSTLATSVTINPHADWKGVAALSVDDIAMVGQSLYLHHHPSLNGGSNQTIQSTNFTAVSAVFAENAAWAVTNGSFISMASPSFQTTPLSQYTLHGIWAQSPTAFFAVGQSGVIYQWSSTGTVRKNSGITDTLFGVGGSGSIVIAVGEAGKIVSMP